MALLRGVDPYDPLEINLMFRWPNLRFRICRHRRPGRDVLSNIIVGSRATRHGNFAVLICMIIGVAVGIGTAVSPKWVETPAIFGIDIILASTVLFAIVLAAVYGPSTLQQS